ncbi:arginase family protein [Pyrococcus yayanosii]|uniref:Arginase n=1 Tax=Pyrococcus yayanosii (strain CH1 / JCM 16557) TaxID=529709 RepID=F8AIK2_PYRYC|nr:arginase family protein [Pyrococcus yayanosii]AEH24368.1 arginase [Pyrococcus yayanosii CH1]
MVTLIALGEAPNREGVKYVGRLLVREGLVDDFRLVEALTLQGLPGIPEDKCYIVGEHLATYGILKRVKPGRIISVDAHTDLMHDYLDHGSWLAYALEERVVERAAVIGPVLMIPATEKSRLWTRRVRIYPAIPRSRKTGRGWRTYVNLRSHGVLGVVEDARRYLGPAIYLTVDLDVLRPEYRIARFQHGELCLEELLELIEAIGEVFTVRAFDMAEISDRVKKSQLGRRAVLEVFQALKEVIE